MHRPREGDRAADGYARARVAEVVPAGQGGCGMRCTGAWHPENSEKAPGGPSRNESSEGSEVIQPRVKGVQVSGARGRRYRTNAGGWSREAGVRTILESLYGEAKRRRYNSIETRWLAE